MVLIKEVYGQVRGYLIDGKIPFKEGLLSLASRGHFHSLGIDKELSQKYLSNPKDREGLTRYQLFEAFLKTLRDNYCEVMEDEKCDFFLIRPSRRYLDNGPSCPFVVGADIPYRTDENYLQIMTVVNLHNCDSDTCMRKIFEETEFKTRKLLIQSDEIHFPDFPSYKEACKKFMRSIIQPYINPREIAVRSIKGEGLDVVSSFG